MATRTTPLTNNQIRFCLEYLKDFNGSRAYQAAYSCSPKTARRNASRLLTNAHIQAFLQKLREQAQKSTAVTLERTVKELALIAFANITDVVEFRENGITLKDSIPSEAMPAIACITEDQSGLRKVAMHSKIHALGMLLEFFGGRSEFNQAIATLQKYGLALVSDPDSELGWKLEAVTSDGRSPP